MDIKARIDEIADRKDFFRKAYSALSANMITGDYVEFGCCGCTTFGLSHQESRKKDIYPHLWAFDSFEGLPAEECVDEHPRWTPGSMAMSDSVFRDYCNHYKIPQGDYTIVKGYYSDTIGNKNYLSNHNLPNDIALAYIDCDTYMASKTCFEFLSDRLKHGMIIALDDYFCWWHSGIAGERRAFLEFMKEHEKFNFLNLYQFGWHGMSFVVEDKNYL